MQQVTVTEQAGQAVAPPAPPAPPGVPQASLPVATSPQAMYQAAREKVDVIKDQLERVYDDRRSVAQRLREGNTDGVDKSGLESRLTMLDQRAADLEKQLAQAEGDVSRLAGIPGAVVREPEPIRNGPPDEVFVIPIVFTIFVLAPLAVAYARRIWKRTGQVVSGIPDALIDRMGRMEQAIDAIALEVERVSEGQRFLTKLMSDRHLGAGAAQPVEQKAREGAHVPR
ncbi:MAG TPA: hypothetical protein VGD77_10650 [Gemmatimonadaceae bacterium]